MGPPLMSAPRPRYATSFTVSTETPYLAASVRARTYPLAMATRMLKTPESVSNVNSSHAHGAHATRRTFDQDVGSIAVFRKCQARRLNSTTMAGGLASLAICYGPFIRGGRFWPR